MPDRKRHIARHKPLDLRSSLARQAVTDDLLLHLAGLGDIRIRDRLAGDFRQQCVDRGAVFQEVEEGVILVAGLGRNEIWTGLPAAKRPVVTDVSPDAACLGLALRFRARGSGRLRFGLCGDDEENRSPGPTESIVRIIDYYRRANIVLNTLLYPPLLHSTPLTPTRLSCIDLSF
jgi:hypothetical protein